MSACAILLAVLPVVDFATNSLMRRIVGTDPAVCLSRYADYPPSRGRQFSANEKFWLKDVDFSCVSPWNDSYGAFRAGTLISRRHVLFAKHFPLGKGARILFVGQDGGVCPCRIQETRPVEGRDILVGLLDYEVTPNIRPAKILPEDYAAYIGDGKGLPIVTFNQQEQAFLSELWGITSDSVSNTSGRDKVRRALAGRIVSGDSGNPAFLLIGNEPILLYCLYSGGIGHGPSVFHRRREIQQAMDELCPGYRLEGFDFAAWSRTCALGADFDIIRAHSSSGTNRWRVVNRGQNPGEGAQIRTKEREK